jgi:conjugal transfer pilus assembly protein TraB
MSAGKIRGYWNGLTPKTKKAITVTLVIAGGALLSLGIHYTRDLSTRKGPPPKTAKKELKIDQHLLEKSAYLEGRKKLEKVENYQRQMEEMKKEIEDLKRGKTQARAASETGLKAGLSRPQASSSTKGPKNGSLPPVPVPPPTTGSVPIPPPSKGTGRGSEEGAIIGGISVVANRDPSGVKGREGDEKKSQKKPTVYLPPSFMAATLLSGLDAPTSEGGKGNPVPVLIRIKDPAFLPNKVRANLRGCFVIADGYGSLADERAHLRAKSLSCLTRRGTSVIDAGIKGFIVDADGKIGLRGTVVSKMGALIARTLLAGFVAGFGDAIKLQSTTVSVSPLGQTQSIDPSKAAQAGLGEGISTASKEIARFYLNLAHQTLPVIECGAVRNITLVVSEGVDLEIREINKTK